jgi:hypothetical protein
LQLLNFQLEINRDCFIEIDQAIVESKKPISSLEELEAWSWDTSQGRKREIGLSRRMTMGWMGCGIWTGGGIERTTTALGTTRNLLNPTSSIVQVWEYLGISETL